MASALRRDIAVVPVLVHGARMPQADELPADLEALAFRNAVELTHPRWDSDVQLLVKALRPYVKADPESAAAGTPARRRTAGRGATAACECGPGPRWH
jgi:hypothetical protein